VLLVHDLAPGGSSGLGGPGGVSIRRPIISTLNLSLPNSDIAAHESGHYFADLVNNFTSAYPGYVPLEAPNSTSQTSSNLIKWNAWIEAGTPFPCQTTTVCASVARLIERDQYRATGWYRPKFDCKMNHLGFGLCDVCGEQIVKTIHQNARPLDGFSPMVSNLMAYSTQAVGFALTPLRPWTHDLEV